MIENKANVVNKMLGSTRKVFPAEEFTTFKTLCNIRKFKSELREATQLRDSAVIRIEKSGVGKIEHINKIIEFCKEYQEKMLTKGILI